MNISDKYLRRERRQRIASDLGISEAEMNQLESYIEWAEESGVYYGRKDHFEKRHRNIKDRFGMSGDY